MKMIIANWKMHLGIRESLAHARGVLRALVGNDVQPTVVVCPSFTALSEVRKVLVRTHVQLGAQTMGPERFGAFTGDVSVAQLDDVGCQYVIIGHSERRAMAGETDALVNQKMNLVSQTSITPILCVGESRDVREQGKAETHVIAQLRAALKNVHIGTSSALVIAYEPVWAIGSGVQPTPAEVVAMHTAIRAAVVEGIGVRNDQLSVVYGGSVTGENAYQYLREPMIDGVLVGSASIKLQEFSAIITAGRDVMVAQRV